MIMGLAQNEFYEDMRLSGVIPNEVTMGSVISAYARVDNTRRNGAALHGFVLKLGLDGFVLVSTNLVHLYCMSSCLRDARMLFDRMKERNVVSWNVMLSGYVKAGLVNLARELFEEIPCRDVVSWGTIIDGSVRLGRASEALALYLEMRHTGLLPSDVMIVNIMSACSQTTN